MKKLCEIREFISAEFPALTLLIFSSPGGTKEDKLRIFFHKCIIAMCCQIFSSELEKVLTSLEISLQVEFPAL